MNAYDKLREQLYSDSFDLQVQPRIRAHTTGSFVSVAGAATDVSQAVTLKPQLQSGDGLLFERLTFGYQPTNTDTVIMMDGAVLWSALGGTANLFGRRRVAPPVEATSSSLGALQVVEDFVPMPQLFSSFDLAGLLGRAGALPLTPITILFAGTLFESSAVVGQAVNWQFDVWYRLVRGLQEN